jgi:hypothetical protein
MLSKRINNKGDSPEIKKEMITPKDNNEQARSIRNEYKLDFHFGKKFNLTAYSNQSYKHRGTNKNST